MSFYATIARYYDAEHVDKVDDLAMYSALADEYGGPIFEFGAGTGRVMLHLAQEGHAVHGIDMEAAMLERAKEKADRLPHLKDNLQFFQGDILKYKTEQKYKLARCWMLTARWCSTCLIPAIRSRRRIPMR
jgi:SAM-dependent methyltransferase